MATGTPAAGVPLLVFVATPESTTAVPADTVVAEGKTVAEYPG